VPVLHLYYESLINYCFLPPPFNRRDHQGRGPNINLYYAKKGRVCETIINIRKYINKRRSNVDTKHAFSLGLMRILNLKSHRRQAT